MFESFMLMVMTMGTSTSSLPGSSSSHLFDTHCFVQTSQDPRVEGAEVQRGLCISHEVGTMPSFYIYYLFSHLNSPTK